MTFQIERMKLERIILQDSDYASSCVSIPSSTDMDSEEQINCKQLDLKGSTSGYMMEGKLVGDEDENEEFDDDVDDKEEGAIFVATTPNHAPQ
ncbi:hypothetical protein C0J52_14086 [Blattella germanica]|nr:hypothetical protein C0J52_14086 [Blattella germanica]